MDTFMQHKVSQEFDPFLEETALARLRIKLSRSERRQHCPQVGGMSSTFLLKSEYHQGKPGHSHP